LTRTKKDLNIEHKELQRKKAEIEAAIETVLQKKGIQRTRIQKITGWLVVQSAPGICQATH